MANILNAIYNIINQVDREIATTNNVSSNRANSMGGALEEYMKDAFAGTFTTIDEQEKNRSYNRNFSWLGNQNNPPDFIMKFGDAVEVKKIENFNSDLALNSSYPKARLYNDSPMITYACRECEDWRTKDIIYAVGCVNRHILYSLWMVYGCVYAAEQNVYERIKTTISTGINMIQDVEFANTKELGRVNRVDPLGITNLRIRGMWSIQHPRKVFEYIQPKVHGTTFEFVCILPVNKYKTFDEDDRNLIESIKKEGFSIEDEEVKDPNNPANFIKVKLIKYII